MKAGKFIASLIFCSSLFSQDYKEVKRIIKNINNGKIYYISKAMNMIKNVKDLKTKFKVWKFFLNKIKSNKFVKSSLENYIYTYINKDITSDFYNEISKNNICTFTKNPSKFSVGYFKNENTFYISYDKLIHNNKIYCRNNVKVVDDIWGAYDTPNGILKYLVFFNKQRYYIDVEGKTTLGPYKNFDQLYYDKDYKNFAFIEADGKKLNVNGQEIRLKYTCPSVAGIFNDNVYLKCLSKKYKNSQFLLHNFKKKFALCNKGHFFYMFSEDGKNMIFVCNSKNLISIFYNDTYIKRYSVKVLPDLSIYIPSADSSKFLHYQISRRNVNGVYENKLIILDIAEKKARLIRTNSNIVFIGDDYFFIKADKSHIYLYRNDEKIMTLPVKIVEHNRDYQPIPPNNMYSIIKVSNKGFYVQLSGGGYAIYWDGKISIIEVKDTSKYYYHEIPHMENNVFIINASDGLECYLYTLNRFGRKYNYKCFYYNKNFKSIIFTKYLKDKNITKLFVEKFKRTFYIPGQLDPYSIYIAKEQDLPYIIINDFRYKSILLIPIINQITIAIPLKINAVIHPHHSFVRYDSDNFYLGGLNSNKIYTFSQLPVSVRKKISDLIKLCKYQKRLCNLH